MGGGGEEAADSGTKRSWVIHESKAVQIHVHDNRCCLYVPWVPASVKNLHNYYKDSLCCGLGGLVVNALDFQAG